MIMMKAVMTLKTRIPLATVKGVRQETKSRKADESR
jgi:hypothetical protein